MNSKSRKTLEQLAKKVEKSIIMSTDYDSKKNIPASNSTFPETKLTESREISEREDSPIRKLDELMDDDKEIQPMKKLNSRREKMKFTYTHNRQIPGSNKKIEEILSRKKEDNLEFEINRVQKRIREVENRIKTENQADRRMNQLIQRTDEQIERSRNAIARSHEIQERNDSALDRNQDLKRTTIKTLVPEKKETTSDMKETIRLGRISTKINSESEIKKHRKGLSLASRLGRLI